MSSSLFEANAKDKTDVLDWGTLPVGKCDLNFRKPGSHPPRELRRTLFVFLTMTLLTVVIGIFLRTHAASLIFGADAMRSNLTISALVLLIVGLALFRLLPAAMPSPGLLLSGLIASGGVLLLWFLAGALSATPAGGLMFLTGIAVPITARAADALATHWVHWCTANPRIDRETMTAWREDWSRRFTGFADRPLRSDVTSPQAVEAHRRVMRMRRSYSWGFFWLLATFFGVPMLVMTLAVLGIVERLEFWIVVEITLVLLWLSFVRSQQAPGSWKVIRQALASWTRYGRDVVADPPWVFQAPGGPQIQRGVFAVVAVILLAIAVFTLLTGEVAHAAETLLATDGFDTVSVLRITFAFGATIFLPTLWFVLACYVVSAPALAAHHWACEVSGGFEQHADWSELDGYFERLRNSRNPEERRHLMAGYNPTHQYPYLLDSELLFEHFHMLGATGIGKTALGLATHTIQIIRRNDGPVIVVDCKGDPAFFHTVRIEAEKAGRTFKWFTNKPYRSTYVFNPLDQAHIRQLTLPDTIGLVTQSLNLHHGDDYGRAWFSIGARVLLKAALLASAPAGSPWARQTTRYPVGQRPPVLSFRDLEDALSVIARNDDEHKAGQHLLFLVESLADFEQLNLAANRAPNHPALRHAIHMPEVIDQRQIVYFYLVGAIDIASVGEIARLALFSALSAAIAHRDRTGERPRVYFIADEAQALAAKNLEMVLAQAREHGLACILAHQSLSQLNPPGGVDLRELVMNCTALKQYFSARDPVLQKYISEISGTVRYVDASWEQLKHRVVGNEFGRRYAAGDVGDIRFKISERLGPRLETEDIHDVSRNLNQSVFIVDRASGYSRFHGAFPMHSDFPVDKQVHQIRREQLAWPDGGDATLQLRGFWPQDNGQTITPTTHPGPGIPLPGPEVQKRLRDLRDRLKGDE
jgi:TraM recognition site of TraD and TraG